MAGHVIIITGAGNGIGLCIVQQLLESQDVQLIVGIDLVIDNLKPFQKDHPDRLELITGDVSERLTSERAVNLAIQKAGKIDTLILNAGIARPIGPINGTDIEDWKHNFDVNFFGMLHTIQLAWGFLQKSEGNILMTSSGIAYAPTQAWTCYATTKSAVNYLCSCLALEDPRIRAVTITPGAVDTGLQTYVRTAEGATQQMRAWLNDLHEKGKLLKPHQPAAAFTKLALEGVPSEIVGKVVKWDDIVKVE